MIRFLYTGDGSSDSQNKSIGGAASNEIVRDGLNNLFEDISYYSYIHGKKQYRAIIMENYSENQINDVKIGYRLENSDICKFKIGLVELNTSGEMEQLKNDEQIPFYSEMLDAEIKDDSDNSIEIGTMESKKKIGVWIEREIVVLDDDNDILNKINNSSIKLTINYNQS